MAHGLAVGLDLRCGIGQEVSSFTSTSVGSVGVRAIHGMRTAISVSELKEEKLHLGFGA